MKITTATKTRKYLLKKFPLYMCHVRLGTCASLSGKWQKGPKVVTEVYMWDQIEKF